MTRGNWRHRWLWIHRWIGLTLGLVFVLIGLTGTILVFDHAIDEWLNPKLLLTSEQGTRASLSSVIEAAEHYTSGEAVSVSKPRVDKGVWTVWFESGMPDAPKYTQVMVDPYTAKVTGERVWGEYVMTWIYRLHFQLVAGVTGAVLVGITGIVVLLSLASGIVLWWPLCKHSWRAAFSVRPGKLYFDLHKLTGVLSAAVLSVIVFTGVYMEFPTWFHAAMSPFSTVSEPPTNLVSNPPDDLATLSPDQAIALAQPRFPGAEFDHLHPPTKKTPYYEVAFRQRHEVQQSYGRSQVFLDTVTGAVLTTRSPDDFTAADALIAWQFPLHNGEAFGMIGRWIVFVAGLMPLVLYVTGVQLWWTKHRKRNSPHRTGNRRLRKQATVLNSSLDTDTENHIDGFESDPDPTSTRANEESVGAS